MAKRTPSSNPNRGRATAAPNIWPAGHPLRVKAAKEEADRVAAEAAETERQEQQDVQPSPDGAGDQPKTTTRRGGKAAGDKTEEQAS